MLNEKGSYCMNAEKIGELIAKITIVTFFVISYCIVSSLDFIVMYGG